MRLMRLAVTGANGFVGRHVVARAAEAGWDVLGIVRSDAAADVVSGAGGRPVILASSGLVALSRALDGSRAVVHLAQIGAERAGQTYEAVNVELTAQVVEACRRAGVPRVVYFSGLGVARYGMKRRCTNPYFLSKLVAETLLFRSDRECVTFRPSFVVGPGDALVRTALAAMAGGEVEMAGDGSYRMQPVAVEDAAALVLAAITRARGAFPIVFDLVGPEPVSYTHLLDRLARIARREGRPTRHHVREIAVAEAERRTREGGYQGMHPDELDCLLCDEVADPSPLVALLGRPLTSLDAALGSAVLAA
jgi:nucleoside-diphosphate-sugar epimerase